MHKSTGYAKVIIFSSSMINLLNTLKRCTKRSRIGLEKVKEASGLKLASHTFVITYLESLVSFCNNSSISHTKRKETREEKGEKTKRKSRTLMKTASHQL